MDIRQLTESQRAYFNTGATRPAAFRRQALERLGHALRAYEARLNAALLSDLNKAPRRATSPRWAWCWRSCVSS